jgi:hypothetical protein
MGNELSPPKYIKDADITIKNIDITDVNSHITITFYVKFNDHIKYKNNERLFKCNICLNYCQNKNEQELIDDAWKAVEKEVVFWMRSLDHELNFEKLKKFIGTKYNPKTI